MADLPQEFPASVLLLLWSWKLLPNPVPKARLALCVATGVEISKNYNQGLN